MKKWGKGMRRTFTSQLEVSFFLKFVRWLASWLVFVCLFVSLLCCFVGNESRCSDGGS